MTPEEFVARLRVVALDRVVEGTLSTIEKPPGRRPRRGLVEIHDWFKGLTKDDHAHVRKVAAMAAHGALFEVLAVLDGVVAVEDTRDKGTFTLTFPEGQQGMGSESS